MVNGKKKLFFSFKWLVLCNRISFVLYILVSLPFIFSFIEFGGPSVHFFFFVCSSRIVLWLQIFTLYCVCSVLFFPLLHILSQGKHVIN